MSTPNITPLPNAPDRADGGADFDNDAAAWAAALPVWTAEVTALGVYTNDQALSAQAAAAAGNLSAIDFLALKGWLLGFKLDGTGVEGVELVPQKQATEVLLGVAMVATPQQAAAGVDDLTMMTPLKSKIGARRWRKDDRLHILDVKPSGTAGGTFNSGGWRIRNLNSEISSISGAGVVWTIAYIAQTANFTLGDVVAGGTSGATAIIVANIDSGATGTLSVVNISGIFVDGEAIAGAMTGSATLNIALGVLSTNEIYLPDGDWRIEASAPAYKVIGHQSRIYDVTGAAVVEYGQSARASATYGGHTNANVCGYMSIVGGALLRIEHICSATNAGNGFGWDGGFGNNNVFTSVIIDRIG